FECVKQPGHFFFRRIKKTISVNLCKFTINQKLGLPLRNLSHELISACKRINGVSEVLKDDRVDASVFVKVSKVQLQGFRLRGTIPRIFSYISQCVVRLFSFFESQ